MSERPTTVSWQSGRFSVAPSRHALLEMEGLAARWWWTAAIPVAVLLGIGVWYDWRYGIVAGMLVFAVLPFVVLTGWLRALGSKGALMSVYDMEAEVNAAGDMTLRFFRKPAPHNITSDDNDADEVTETGTEYNSDAPSGHAPEPLILRRSDLSDVKLWRGNAVFEYWGINVIIPLSDTIRPELRTLLGLTGMWESHIFV